MQLDGDLEAIVEESWTWARKHELISFNCSYPLEWIAWAEQFFDQQQTKPLAKVQLTFVNMEWLQVLRREKIELDTGRSANKATSNKSGT